MKLLTPPLLKDQLLSFYSPRESSDYPAENWETVHNDQTCMTSQSYFRDLNALLCMAADLTAVTLAVYKDKKKKQQSQPIIHDA